MIKGDMSPLMPKTLNPSPTPVGRLLRRWVKVHCDLYDFGWEGIAGEVVRPPLDAIERHLNANGWQERLDPQRHWHLESHRSGGTALFVATKRRAVGRCPGITRCYRVPIGSDPATAEAVVECLNVLHRGLLYTERETDAYYAYASYSLPWRRRCERGDKIYLGTAATNKAMREFELWLAGMFAARGWAVPVEVLGSFTETTRGERGKKCVVAGQRAQLFRAPKCPDGDAFLRLRLSRFNHGEVPWLWDATARADALLPPRAGYTALFQPETPQLRQSVFESLRYFFGATLPRHPLRPSQLCAVEQRAAELWRQRNDRGMYEFTLDHTLKTVIRKFVHRVLRKWAGPAGCDNHTLHFGAFAVEEAEALIRSLISKARLRALNHNPKLRWARVTYRALAVALCTVAKNSLVNDQYVPTKSVKHMLRFWGIGTNGSHVKALMEALVGAGLIRCTDGTYGEGLCRRFSVADVVILNLDFLSSFRQDVTRRAACASTAAAAGPYSAVRLKSGEPEDALPETCIGLRLGYVNMSAQTGVGVGVGREVAEWASPEQFGEDCVATTWGQCAPSCPTSKTTCSW